MMLGMGTPPTVVAPAMECGWDEHVEYGGDRGAYCVKDPYVAFNSVLMLPGKVLGKITGRQIDSLGQVVIAYGFWGWVLYTVLTDRK